MSPRPYVRPMGAWWRRDPFFMRYMWREATAIAVLAYALVLTVGLVRLAQGEAVWTGYVHALRSPASIVLHLVLLVSMAVHAWTWFEIMPKTMAAIYIGGRRVAASTITRSGFAAVIVATLLIAGLARWW